MRNQTNDTILQGTYTWTGAGGSTDFAQANNWINQATGQPGAVPNANDEGNFIGAGLCTGTGTLGDLYADGVGGWGFFLDGTISVASFAAGGGTLEAVLPQKIADHISFWGAGDVIDLTTIDVVSDSYANGTLTLKGAHQTFSPLHFTGSYTSANFVLTPDHHGGTLITFHTGG